MASTINATPTSSGLVQSADASGVLALQTGGTTAVTIDGSQNVGIGTSSPGGRLDVRTTGTASATIARFSRSDAAVSADIFYDGSDGAISFGTTTNHPIAFDTNNTERMRIDSAGSVLIGTTDNNFTNGIGLKIANSVSARLKLCDSDFGTGASDGFEFTAAGTDGYIYNLENGFMAFGTNATERMRIDSSGRVVISGTTSIGAMLNVFSPDNTNNCISTQVFANGNTAIGFRNTSSSQVGSIITNSGGVAYNTTSDYRLKENIAPMANALAKVQALKPVTYTWKADGSSGQGFIAHELQAVVPDCVTGEKDAMRTQQYEVSPAIPATLDEEGNELTPAVEAVMGEREVPAYQGIDTSFLVATLTCAIQELKAELDSVKAELATLKVQP